MELVLPLSYQATTPTNCHQIRHRPTISSPCSKEFLIGSIESKLNRKTLNIAKKATSIQLAERFGEFSRMHSQPQPEAHRSCDVNHSIMCRVWPPWPQIRHIVDKP